RPAILDLDLVGGSVSMSGYPALRELKLPAVLTGSDRCPPPPGRELRLLRPAPPIDFGGRPSGRGWLPSLPVRLPAPPITPVGVVPVPVLRGGVLLPPAPCSLMTSRSVIRLPVVQVRLGRFTRDRTSVHIGGTSYLHGLGMPVDPAGGDRLTRRHRERFTGAPAAVPMRSGPGIDRITWPPGRPGRRYPGRGAHSHGADHGRGRAHRLRRPGRFRANLRQLPFQRRHLRVEGVPVGLRRIDDLCAQLRPQRVELPQ